jgi:ribosome recycling factor
VTDEVLLEAEESMDAALVHLRDEFSRVRSGRASPVLVEKIPVEYYGSTVPLQQLAGVTAPEARVLLINPYDKGALTGIERAIQASDLGVTPSNDGSIIRLNFPPLTEERRRDLVKVVKKSAEQGRVSVRNARRTARQNLESSQKDGDISEDDLVRAEKELDALTDKYVKEVDNILERKEAELLEV